MASTHTFTGLSGIEFEVSSLTGKHQRLFSEKNGISINAFNTILSDTVKRIGSLDMSTLSESERISTVKQIPSDDRAKLLFVIRQFTLNFPEIFSYEYEYVSNEIETRGRKLTEVINIDIKNAIVEKEYPFQAEELESLQKDFEITLPNCGEVVKYTLLDGEGELIAIKEKNPSSHTEILARQPKFLRTTNKEGELLKQPQWVKIDTGYLDKMNIQDIEALRGDIRQNQGSFKTIASFEHPETGNWVDFDLLGNANFFYPSRLH